MRPPVPSRHLALLLALLPSLAPAAESADVLRRSRTRAGAWAAAGLTNGRLEFRDATTAIDTAVTALPVVQLGAEVWPDGPFGVRIVLDMGTGIDLDLPDGSATLAYNLHQLHAGARYRHHFGPGATAGAFFFGLGLRGMRESIQAQRPALLVDRTIAGPEAEVGLEWVLLSDRIWVRADARLALPFFVRETPADSGDPDSFVGYGAGLDLVARLVGGVSLQLSTALYVQSIEFAGEGTRATRVVDATTDDRLLTTTLGLRYAL